MSRCRMYFKCIALLGLALVFLGRGTAARAEQDWEAGENTAEESVEFTYDFRNPEIEQQMKLALESKGWSEEKEEPSDDSEETSEETQEDDPIRIGKRGWENVDMEMFRLRQEFSAKVYVDLEKESFVTVYSQTDTGSAYTGKLFPGACAELIGQEGQWYQIRSVDFEGYVRKEDVLSGDDAADKVAAQLTEEALVVADVLNIRQIPSAEGERIGRAKAGETYVIQQKGGAWCEILLDESGRTGYVAAEYISIQYNFQGSISAKEEQRIAEEKRKKEEEERRQREEAERKQKEEEARRQQEAAAAAAAAKEQQRLDAIAAQAGLPAGSLISLGIFRITHYCACESCTGRQNATTATGTIPTVGRSVAVYPKQIPYGSTVVVDGHAYVAEDCGGGIKTNCLDIFVGDHDLAFQLGVIYREVFVRVK